MNQPNFLVVGLEKSGTHWVTALLNSHPQISCFPSLPFRSEAGGYNPHHLGGEVHFFDTLASLEKNTEGKFTRPLETYLENYDKYFADLVPYQDKVSKSELYQMFKDRYNELCTTQKGNKKIVGESSPAYTFHLDFIDSFYPNIKKLCIIRDPKDRIVSWYFNQVRKGRIEDTGVSDEFAVRYLDSRIIKEYEALLEYNKQVHCFTYEKLSENPKSTITRILKYLEVKIADEIIDHMINEASFKKLNAIDNKSNQGRERGQASIKSHYRKGIVGDWKNYLSASQAKMIDDKINDLQTKIFNKKMIKN